MKYNVIDIDPAMDYLPGEEVIGTVEAETPEEAILAALKAISPIYLADMIRSDSDGVAKHILSDYVASPA